MDGDPPPIKIIEYEMKIRKHYEKYNIKKDFVSGNFILAKVGSGVSNGYVGFGSIET